MPINVQRIALTHETLHFLYSSAQGVLYDFINALALFLVILQQRNSCKVEVNYISSARKTARKITKNAMIVRL